MERYNCYLRLPSGAQANLTLATPELLGLWLADLPWQRWAINQPLEIRIERVQL